MTKWQPMRPGDKTKLVIWPEFWTHGPCIEYERDGGPASRLLWAVLNFDNQQWTATHWQPIPLPPEN